MEEVPCTILLKEFWPFLVINRTYQLNSEKRISLYILFKQRYVTVCELCFWIIGNDSMKYFPFICCHFRFRKLKPNHVTFKEKFLLWEPELASWLVLTKAKIRVSVKGQPITHFPLAQPHNYRKSPEQFSFPLTGVPPWWGWTVLQSYKLK